MSTEKKPIDIHTLLTSVGKRKHIKYLLGRSHWTQKHITTMKRRLSKDSFATWYKGYIKQIDKERN